MLALNLFIYDHRVVLARIVLVHVCVRMCVRVVPVCRVRLVLCRDCLFRIALHSIVPSCIGSYCIVSGGDALYGMWMGGVHCIVQCCVVRCCVGLHCAVMHRIRLHCTLLH